MKISEPTTPIEIPAADTAHSDDCGGVSMHIPACVHVCVFKCVTEEGKFTYGPNDFDTHTNIYILYTA